VAARRWAGRLATAAAALVLVASWMPGRPGPAAGAEPERARGRVVSRLLEVDDAVQAAPAWERRLYALAVAEGASDLGQAIAWYEELAARSGDPLVEVRLAVLEGEAGRLDALRRRLDAWQGQPDLRPCAALLRRAYFEEAADRPSGGDGPCGWSTERVASVGSAALADLPPLEPWFRDRLLARLAARAGEASLLSEVRREQAARGEPLRARLRAYLALQGVVAAGGAVALALVVADRRRLRVAAAPPPPWTMGTGAVVLLWGGALDVVLAHGTFAAWRYTGLVPPFAGSVLTLAPMLPLLWLAHRRLLAPGGLGVARAFGLRPAPGGGRALALSVVLLVAAGLGVDMLLGFGAERLGLASHWTEWFDEDLVFGSAGAVADSVVAGVVLAPVLEEVVFRGLLYATLRRRLVWSAAAAASAACFALAHGYGALGSADVWLSGVLWAWAYERTGSLWPGIAAHAAANLLAVATNVVFFR
jgi:membrane protease YdiL (CAAX protease family)